MTKTTQCLHFDIVFKGYTSQEEGDYSKDGCEGQHYRVVPQPGEVQSYPLSKIIPTS